MKLAICRAVLFAINFFQVAKKNRLPGIWVIPSLLTVAEIIVLFYFEPQKLYEDIVSTIQIV